MAIVCKFPAGTKTLGRLNRQSVDANGFPCTDKGKYDADGKKCKAGEYTDGKNTYKRYVATRGCAFFGPKGDIVTGHDGYYGSNLAYMDENGVEKYHYGRDDKRVTAKFPSAIFTDLYRVDDDGNVYHYSVFVPVYQASDGTLRAYDDSWKASYVNEDGKTKMPDEVFDGYKDYDGKVVKGTTYTTSSFEIPNTVVAIDEIDGADTGLTVMVYNTTPPAVGKVVNVSSDDLLLVPKGSLDAYKKDAKWGKFKSISEFDINAADPVMAAAQSPEIVELLKKIDARLTAIEAKLK